MLLLYGVAVHYATAYVRRFKMNHTFLPLMSLMISIGVQVVKE
jgi:hypothetical protein